MGHSITAIILKGDYNKEIAEEFDLRGKKLTNNLNLFFIDYYYTACWQKKLGIEGLLEVNCHEIIIYPREQVIYHLMKEISTENDLRYSVILTDYHGGIGNQYANLFLGKFNVDLNLSTINQVLNKMGVQRSLDQDEFDVIGLGLIRQNPDFLEVYQELAEELGV